MLGLSTWKAGDLDKSQKAFETALTIDPDHLKSLVNLSRVLIEKKQYDEAINTLMKAGDVEPNSTTCIGCSDARITRRARRTMPSMRIPARSSWTTRMRGR